MTSVSTVIGFIPLIVLNIINYQISHRLIHPLLQGYLLSTNSNSVTTNLNLNLKDLNIEYQVKQIKALPSSNFKFLKPLINTTVNGDSKQRLIDLSVRFLFHLSISLSLQIISLVLIEIIGLGNEESVSLYWSFTLFILIILLSYLIPSLLLLDVGILNIPFLKRRTVSNSKAYILTYVFVLLSWVILLQLMDFKLDRKVNLSNSESTTAGLSFVQGSLIELSLIGVLCLAFLNGMGCVTQLFNTYFRKLKPVKLQDIKKIIDSLKTTENLIDLRQQEADRQTSMKSHQHSRSITDFTLQDEIKALTQMKNDLIDELTNLVNNYKLQQNSKSMNGRVKKLYDYSFGLFCLYKIVTIGIFKLSTIIYDSYNKETSSLNQTNSTPHTQHSDPLAITIANIVVHILGKDYYDIDQLSINITIALSLCLFLLSFNSVKMTMDKFSKVTNHSSSSSSSQLSSSLPLSHDVTTTTTKSMVKSIIDNKSTISSATPKSSSTNGTHKSHLIELFISELSGIYIISTTLMLNSNTLPHHLAKFDEVGIDKIANEIVENWYTKWFALSCLVSIVELLIIQHVEKVYWEFDFDDDIYDEEMMAENGKFA